MSNVNNRKVTIKDVCDTTLSWITSNAINTQSGWSIDNVAPNTATVPYGLSGRGDRVNIRYTRIAETAFNYVAPSTVSDELLAYLQQVFDSSVSLNDTTTVLTASRLSLLESALSVFIFSKVKTYTFDGTFVNQTTRKFFLYDTSALVPTNLTPTSNNTNIMESTFINNLLNNLGNNLQYNNNHKQVRYSESHTCCSCCSSSSCSSSSSSFLAHI